MMTLRELTKPNTKKNLGRAETAVEIVQSLAPYLPHGVHTIAVYKARILDEEAGRTTG